MLKLAWQLIPAMLGEANYWLGGCDLPDYIDANITLGTDLVGDRVFPPVGSGLCACCATSSCTTSSVCHSSRQGCVQLTNAQVTNIASALQPWNANGECGVAQA